MMEQMEKNCKITHKEFNEYKPKSVHFSTAVNTSKVKNLSHMGDIEDQEEPESSGLKKLWNMYD